MTIPEIFVLGAGVSGHTASMVELGAECVASLAEGSSSLHVHL